MAVQGDCEDAVRELLHAGADVKVHRYDRKEIMDKRNMYRCTTPWDRAMTLLDLTRRPNSRVDAILREAGATDFFGSNLLLHFFGGDSVGGMGELWRIAH
jgi:hypothetical protein